MDTVLKVVRRAAWRLSLQRAAELLLWSWTVAAFGAALIAAAGKLFAWPPWQVVAVCGVLMGISTIVGGVLGWLFRVRLIRAAAELDRAFALEDRVSSLITVPADLKNEPACQALLRDVMRRLEGIEVGERIRWKLPRPLWAPLVPAVLGIACWLLLPSWQQQARVQGTVTDRPDAALQKEAAERLRRAAEPMNHALKVLMPQAEGEGEELKKLRELLGELERLTKELKQKPEKRLDPDRALSKLGEVEKQLQQQRARLAEQQKLRNTLADLARRAEKAAASQGPLAKFQQALRQGQLDEAAEQLRKLAEQIQNAKLDPAQKQRLQQQLQQLAEELKKLQQLKEAKERLLKSGLKGKELQKALQALQQQLGDPQRLQQLARGLQQAARLAGRGRAAQQGLANQLEALAEQLEQIANDLDAQALNDAVMDAIAQLRRQMACERCRGKG